MKDESLDTDAQDLIDEITNKIFALVESANDHDYDLRIQEIDKLKDRLLKDYGIAYNNN